MIKWAIATAFMAVVITISSLIPGDESGYASSLIAVRLLGWLPITPQLANFLFRKAAHFVVYFLLAFCLAKTLQFRIHKWALVAWLAAAWYGIGDEILQSFVPGRVMAISDMLINAAGAGVAVILLYWLDARQAKPSATSAQE
jgi:VanZ family protein